MIYKNKKKKGRSRKTVALFGGAFDPPQRGHVAMVRALLRHKPRRVSLRDKGIDAIWILPVYRHPFGKKLSPFSMRFAMCRLAFSSLSKRVTVRRFEEKIGGKSYTVRTLKALCRRYPATRFVLVIGSDSYRDRKRWKDFKQIQAMADIAIFSRGPRSKIPNISSSDIRRQAAAGKIVDELVPKRVANYIRRKGLYAKI